MNDDTAELPPPARPETVRRLILGVAAAAAVLLAVGVVPKVVSGRRLANEATAAAPVRVTTAPPVRAAGSKELVLPGDARPAQQTSVYPRSDGYLSALHVDIGDTVAEGDLLAEIAAPEVDAQYARAAAALEQAKAGLLSAETDLKFANATLGRFEGLAKTGGVTVQQLDERRSAAAVAAARLGAAKAERGAAEAEERRVNAVRGFLKVYAPIPGVVETRNYDVGTLLSAAQAQGEGRELFRIDRVDVLRVFVSVPQLEATDVAIGQPAEFMVKNYPGERFGATVTRWAGALDPATRTVRVEVRVPNADRRLLSGMYGRVALKITRSAPLLTVPAGAVIYRAQGPVVAVVEGGPEGDVVRFRTVTLGEDVGASIEILTGLGEHDRVVQVPGDGLRDGAKVAPA